MFLRIAVSPIHK